MAEPIKVTLSDGCRLNVKVLGNASGKPLMIALHGAPGLITHIEPEASFGGFADVFRVVVFDSRGSGDSDKKGPYTHARWVEDIDELRSVYILSSTIRTGLVLMHNNPGSGLEPINSSLPAVLTEVSSPLTMLCVTSSISVDLSSAAQRRKSLVGDC